MMGAFSVAKGNVGKEELESKALTSWAAHTLRQLDRGL